MDEALAGSRYLMRHFAAESGESKCQFYIPLPKLLEEIEVLSVKGDAHLQQMGFV